jgi:hypothetical protein
MWVEEADRTSYLDQSNHCSTDLWRRERSGVKAPEINALGRTAFVFGCICALLLLLLVVDMSVQLQYMPEEWSRLGGEGPASLGRFDLRMMVICPGPVGWLGLWGYLLSFVWIPIAAYRAWRATRAAAAFTHHERFLLALIPTLLVVIEMIFHMTPLKYGYPLF